MKEKNANVFVNAATVFAAAALLGTLQGLLPGMPWSGLKLPLAVFAGVYWMLFAKPWVAWPGAMWAGAVLDGLGGVAWGAGIFGMLLMCWGMRELRAVSGLVTTVPGSALACGVAGVLVVLAQGAVNGGLRMAGWARASAGAAEIFVAGTLVGAAVCGGLWLLDSWLGNFKERETDDDAWMDYT